MGMITTPLFSPALRSKQGTLIGFKGKRLKELFLLCCHDASMFCLNLLVNSFELSIHGSVPCH